LPGATNRWTNTDSTARGHPGPAVEQPAGGVVAILGGGRQLFKGARVFLTTAQPEEERNRHKKKGRCIKNRIKGR
jgi:hypothetical protein